MTTRTNRSAAESKPRGVFIGWSLPGSAIEEGPISAREAKPIGAIIHVRGLVRKFEIRHHDNWGDDRYPWKVRERLTVGTKAPVEIGGEVVEEHPSLSVALRATIKLAKGAT